MYVCDITMWRQNSQVKVALWQNSQLSYLSHFKRQKVSLFQKRNAVQCHVKMFPLITAIFKFLKYANKQTDGFINSTKFCLNYEEKYNNLANLYQVFCSKNPLWRWFHHMTFTVLLPWQHTGLQTFAFWRLFYTVPIIGIWRLLCSFLNWSLIWMTIMTSMT